MKKNVIYVLTIILLVCAIINNGSVKVEAINETDSTNSNINKSVHASFACYYDNGYTWAESAVKMIGNYTVDIENNTITSANNPIVSLLSFQDPFSNNGYLNMIYSDAVISGDRSTVTFYATFELHIVPTITLNSTREKKGTYTLSITADTNGFVSRNPSDGYSYPNQ